MLNFNNSKFSSNVEEDEKTKVIEKSCIELNKISSEFIDIILSDESVKEIPFDIKAVSKIICNLAEKVEWSIPPILGNFIMLRIFNTGIIFADKNPYFEIKNVSPEGRRNLILISKMLQNLANGIEFGTKEAYMIPMNKTIENYLKKTISFFMAIPISEQELKESMEKKEEIILSSFQKNTLYTSCFEDLRRIHDMVIKHKECFEKYYRENDIKDGKKYVIFNIRLSRFNFQASKS